MLGKQGVQRGAGPNGKRFSSKKKALNPEKGSAPGERNQSTHRRRGWCQQSSGGKGFMGERRGLVRERSREKGFRKRER